MGFWATLFAIGFMLLIRPIRTRILDWLENLENSFLNLFRKEKKYLKIDLAGRRYYDSNKFHLVEETKEYSQEELSCLKGKEINYIANALAKDKILGVFLWRHTSSRPSSGNYFMIEKDIETIKITIGMYMVGAIPNQSIDENHACRMRYILNCLPFMADIN